MKTVHQSRNHQKLFLLSILLTGMLSWIGCEFSDLLTPQSTPQRKLSPAITQIHALGRLEPASRVIKLSAPFGAQGVRVEKLFIEEGQNVNERDLLARLDNATLLHATLDQARTQLSVAEAKLIQIEAGAKQADIKAKELAALAFKVEVEKNKKMLNRVQQLREKNVVTQEELEQRAWEYEQSQLNYEQATALWESIKQVRDTDVAVARQEVYAAQASLEKCKADLLQAEITAPIKGRILKIHTRVGEKLGDNPLLEMGNVDEMHAVAEVYEADLGKLTLGMSAKVYVSSLEQTLNGSVCELGYLVARKDVLSNDPVSDTDARVVEVRIKLDADATAVVQRLSQARVEVSLDLMSTKNISDSDGQSPQGIKGR